MYSQDLSNRKTAFEYAVLDARFLYSQDLSNRKTIAINTYLDGMFLYSQDLSNRKTFSRVLHVPMKFLYSQDLSNFCIYYLKSVERDFMTSKIFFGEWMRMKKLIALLSILQESLVLL